MRRAAPQAARVSVIPAARPAMQRTARVGPVDDPRQRKADRIADHVVRISETAIVAMAARPQISRKCRACADEEKLQTRRASPQTAAADAPAPMVPRSPPQIMRAGPKRFRKRLGRADAQATVLDALFDNDQFRTYWNCLTACGEGGTVGFAAVLRGDVETSGQDAPASAESAAASPAAVIQRMTAEAAEEDPEGKELQRAPAAAGCRPHCGEAPADAAANAVIEGGSPLPASERAHFEPRFGRDFSGVRIHICGEASGAANAINTHAFTLGHHIAFADGQFRPDAPRGGRLLAHELTHTVQQTGTIRRGDIGWTGLARRCCNTSPGSEWALVGDPSEWRALPPDECTGSFEDCDGMTCGGGFYAVLHRGTCRTPREDDAYSKPRRWTATAAGPIAQSPTARAGPGRHAAGLSLRQFLTSGAMA
jgi:hypothetical protein